MSSTETKRDKFVRLAQARTESVMDRIRVLGNLSNHYVYDFREEDIEKIFSAIEESLRIEREKFAEQLRRRQEREQQEPQPPRRRFELVA